MNERDDARLLTDPAHPTAEPQIGVASLSAEELQALLSDVQDVLRDQIDRVIAGDIQHVSAVVELGAGGRAVRAEVTFSTRVAR